MKVWVLSVCKDRDSEVIGVFSSMKLASAAEKHLSDGVGKFWFKAIDAFRVDKEPK